MPSLAGSNSISAAPSLAANYRVYVVNPTGPVDYYTTLETLLELSTGVDNTAYLRTDGTRALAGTWDIDNNFITNVPTPTLSHHPANKSYVDSAAAGLEVQTAVRVATTAAGTLATDFENGDTVDGVVLATGDRILIKDQADGTENGPYTVEASGAPTRAAEATTSTAVAKFYWAVEEGDDNSGTGWSVTNASGSDVIDTDAIDLQKFITPPSGAAPATADFVTLAAHGTLTKERVLVTSEGVTHTDAGANNNVTLKLDVNGLTEDTAPDTAADFVVTYDTSASAHKKVKPNNLGLSPPFSDATPRAKNSSDGTKRIQDDLSAIATATTRTHTWPDSNIDFTPGSGTYASASHGIDDLSDVTITSATNNQVLRYNSGSGLWVNSTFDASYIGSGQVTPARGGTGLDASGVAIGDVIAGTGAGTMGLVTATGHSDGDVLTIQADGSVDFEAIPGGGTQWTDTGTLLHPADSSGAEDVAIGQATALDSARLTVTKAGLPLSLENTTDAASNQIAVLRGNDRATPATNDEAYISLQLDDSAGTSAEFARITFEANDETNTSKDGELRFAVQVANTLTDTFQVDETGIKTLVGDADFSRSNVVILPSDAAPTVNADGEIALDSSVADWSHYIPRLYGGEELFVLTMPVAQLTTPTDGHVVAYNATNDELELVAQSGGGGGSGFVIDEVCPPASDAATPSMRAGGSTPAENVPSHEFTDAAIDYMDFLCHVNGYGGGGLTVTVPWTSDTATTGNARLEAAIRRMEDDVNNIATAHTYDFNFVEAAAPSSAGEWRYSDITFSDGTDMDELADGDKFILRVRLNGTHANNTIDDTIYVFTPQLKET